MPTHRSNAAAQAEQCLAAAGATPVRIDLDRVPEGVRLVAGQTARVQIGPKTDGRL